MIDADTWTQGRLDDMESHLKEVYEDAYKDLNKKTKEHFAKMQELDIKKKKLVESGKLSQEEYERWRRTQLFQGKQMQQMTKTVAQELLKVNQTATAYVNGQLPSVYTFNYNSSGQDIEGQVSGYSFDIYDEQTVMNLSTDDSSLLPYKEVNGQKDIRWNTKQVNSEVLQGIIQGESIPEIASRLEKVTGMNRASAIRNARTSMTSAQNKGRIDSYRRAQQDGVILKKKWLAANQPGRTRDWHAELNNVESDVEKPFFNSFGKIMYPGDPYAKPANVYNCRCTLVSVVKGFKKVGENTSTAVDNVAESGIIKTSKNNITAENIAEKQGSKKKTSAVKGQKTQNFRVGSITYSEEAKTKLYQHERIISGNKYKTATIYDKNGNIVFKKKGNADSVSFTVQERKKMKGCVLTHNHPDGSIFSPEDINMLRVGDLDEIRACNNNGAFVLRRSDKWHEDISDLKKLDEKYWQAMNEVSGKYRDKAAKEGKSILSYLDDMDKDGMQLFCDRYGFEFTWEEG